MIAVCVIETLAFTVCACSRWKVPEQFSTPQPWVRTSRPSFFYFPPGAAAAAAATPAPAAAARLSRSRGRSAAAEEKKTPTPTRRGRGKAKKEESEEEEEVVEKEEEKDEEEEEEEEEVTPKRGRGRGKGKAPAASKKATPPSGGSRSSRQSAEVAVEKTDEPKKTTPRGRGGSRSASASKPQSRSRRGAGEAEAEEEKEEAKQEEEGKGEDAAAERMDESGEAKKEEKKSEAAEEKAEPEGEGKVEVTEGKAEVTETAKTEKVDSPAKEKPAPIEAPAPALASSVEAMEEETPPTAAPQPAADTKNGEVDDVRPSPKAGMKRKLEAEGGEAGEQVDNLDAKRARINGTETEKKSAGAAADVEMKDSKKAAAKEDPSDGNILKDFVVVNKDEVPAPDSSEVAAAVPREVVGAKVAAAEPMETEGKAEQSGSTSSTLPVTVVPLTEAEMAKAYASDVQVRIIIIIITVILLNNMCH